jgi:hypothetical protein
MSVDPALVLATGVPDYLSFYDLKEFPPISEHLTGISFDSYFQEELTCIYFHLTRTSCEEKTLILRTHLEQVLDTFKKNLEKTPRYITYFKLFYRLIGQTCDIFYGKGEHDLTYMMIWVWYQRYPILAIYAIHRIVKSGFGSWRNMKYLCQYFKKQGVKSKGLIDACVDIMNLQLNTDLEIMGDLGESCSRNDISNVAKWIPREHKKFDWLYELLVLDWANKTNPWILASTKGSIDSFLSAKSKCKRLYRRTLATLNKILDTTEIKLCSKNRRGIKPENVSEYTLIKQPKILFHYDECSQKFKEYFDKKIVDFSLDLNKENSLNGENFPVVLPPLAYFVKEALQLIHSEFPSDYKSGLLDKRWKILSKSVGLRNCENILPILDMSFSIQINDSESYYTAIGMAILIAEHSSFGKRILVTDNMPVWVNLEDNNSFVSCVQTLDSITVSNRSTFSDFTKGLDMIILGLISYNIDNPDRKQRLIKDVENLKIVFLSDFCGFLGSDNITELSNFEKMNHRFTLNLGTPSPQFIFWNLGKHYNMGVSIPCSINQPNTMFLSGFPANLLKVLNYPSDKRITPYKMVCNILNNDRYNLFDEYIDQVREP